MGVALLDQAVEQVVGSAQLAGDRGVGIGGGFCRAVACGIDDGIQAMGIVVFILKEVAIGRSDAGDPAGGVVRRNVGRVRARTADCAQRVVTDTNRTPHTSMSACDPRADGTILRCARCNFVAIFGVVHDRGGNSDVLGFAGSPQPIVLIHFLGLF